jgi:hypothetical protein
MQASWRQIAAVLTALALPAALAAGPIADDPVAARAFLKELIQPTPLTPAQRARAPKLLADLGHHAYRVREVASKELLRLGPQAEGLLVRFDPRGDAEAATRVRDLLAAYKAAREDAPSLVCHAAGALTARKDKYAVDVLVALLGHDHAMVRHVSEYALRYVTGMRLGYNAHDPGKPRHAAAARWAAWWKTRRAAFDFTPAGHVRRVAAILCWGGYTRNVLRVGLDGKIAWHRQLPNRSLYVDPLGGGRLLAASYKSPKGLLEEYDAGGKLVWQAKDLPFEGALRCIQRLPSGNTLGIDYGQKRVIELDPACRRIVWEHSYGQSLPLLARRLPGGHTLLAWYSGTIQEITPAGEVVWTRAVPGSIRDVQKLPNGHLLIAQYVNRVNRVVELTPAGREVWTWSPPTSYRVSAARRLPDGRTAVMGRHLHLVDPPGTHAKLLLAPDKPLWACRGQLRLVP